MEQIQRVKRFLKFPTIQRMSNMKKLSLFIVSFFAILLSLSANAASLGNPIVSVYSTAAEASHVLKSTGGLLNGFSATTSTTGGYVLLFDATALPANGAVTPKLCYYVPSYPQTMGATWLTYPVPFNNGIVIAFSTTGCFTLTASATAFFNAQVQ